MNQEINLYIAKELNINLKQVEATLKMLEEGDTVPFISRYRKERTGNLEEVVINDSEGIKAKVSESIFLGLNTHYYVLSDTVHCEHTEAKDDDRIELIQESLID